MAETGTRRAWPHRRSPTINDLRTKTCWICLGTSTSNSKLEARHKQKNPTERWIHPCKCTLVAHESCLLKWIANAEANQSQTKKALQCPQCTTKYIVKSQHPLVLRIMNRGHAFITRVYKTGAIASVVGGVVTIAGVYGGFAMRSFLGPEAFAYYFGTTPYEYVWHAMEFSFLPFILLGSSTASFLGAALPIAHLVMLPGTDIFTGEAGAGLHQIISTYPPSPMVTMLIFPYAQLAYDYLWNKIAGYVARPTRQNHASVIRRALQGGMNLDIEVVPDMPGAAAQLLDQHGHGPNGEGGEDIQDDAPEPLNDDDLLGIAADPNANGNQAGNQAGVADGNERRANALIRLTPGYLLRVVLRSLLSPFISQVAGEGLRLVSGHSSILRKVLGLEGRVGMIGYGGPRLTGVGLGLGASSGTAGSVFRPWSSLTKPWIVGPPSLRDLDPVWWRNAIGLSLFVIVADATTLFHLWLAIREKRSRRILNRDFSDVDPNELDLIT